MDMKFYKCKHCGQMVAIVKETGVPIICCGEPMEEIIAGTTDAAVEKHVPVVTREGDKVTVSVGSVAHPMTAEHYIQFVILDTTAGVQIASLNPNDDPAAVFTVLSGAQVKKAYAYCNLHGFWVSE